MAIAKLFTWKGTLDEANTIKRALEAQKQALIEQVQAAGGYDKLPATAQEIGRIDMLIRRDF